MWIYIKDDDNFISNLINIDTGTRFNMLSSKEAGYYYLYFHTGHGSIYIVAYNEEKKPLQDLLKKIANKVNALEINEKGVVKE